MFVQLTFGWFWNGFNCTILASQLAYAINPDVGGNQWTFGHFEIRVTFRDGFAERCIWWIFQHFWSRKRIELFVMRLEVELSECATRDWQKWLKIRVRVSQIFAMLIKTLLVFIQNWLGSIDESTVMSCSQNSWEVNGKFCRTFETLNLEPIDVEQSWVFASFERRIDSSCLLRFVDYLLTLDSVTKMSQFGRKTRVYQQLALSFLKNLKIQKQQTRSKVFLRFIDVRKFVSWVWRHESLITVDKTTTHEVDVSFFLLRHY